MDNITNVNSNSNFILQYSINTIILLSTGFISGGLVHIGFNNKNNPYYIGFGIFGCFLFVLGNYLQEKIINKKQLIGFNTIFFLLSTLGLAIGIGMMSGGLQHFTDFPNYAKYLIPIGFFLSILFFNFKSGLIKMNKFLPILGISALLCVLIFGGTNYFASNQKSTTIINKNTNTLPSKDGCPSGQSKREMPGMCMNDSQLNPALTKPAYNMEGMDMTSMIKDDQSFIQSMIPHHLEAIQTSQVILNSTNDQDLKTFAKKVILDQNKEVDSMKTWFKTITGSEYKDDGTYMPMMTGMMNKSSTELDKEYIKGMIFHHNGAIDMAKKVLPISKSQDVKTLANNIITNQTGEVIQLENWIKTKYNEQSAVPNLVQTEQPTSDDGHAGH